MKNTLETRLGIFFALALFVAVLLLEMIGAFDFFKGGYHVNASFKNAQELKKGDLVKTAGVEIGRVEDIKLEGGRATVVMKIRDEFEIKTDSKALIKFTGLMGQNFVALEGGSPTAARALDGAALETGEQPDIGSLMAKLDAAVGSVEGLAKSFSTDNLSTLLGPVTDFVKQNSPVLTAMIANLRTVSDNVVQGKGAVGMLINDEATRDSVRATLNNLQTVSTDLKQVLGNADTLVTDARQVLARVNAGEGNIGLLLKDDAFYREGTNAITNLREILQKINRGQGSVGKLLNDDALYKNAKLSLQKLEKATEGLEDQGPLSVLGIAVNSLF
jgi:phospholipid/cholesterol/gamma-HCH transport system substrate-binding protein